MKRTGLYISLAGAMVLAACSDVNRDVRHDGKLFIEPSYIGEVQVTEIDSRAATDDSVYTYTDESLRNSTLLWISNLEGVVREYKGLSSFPKEGDRLMGDIYIAEAWAGDSVSASWTARYYKAWQEFMIDGDLNLELELELANVFASVVIDESIDAVLRDYEVTVSHSRGSKTFVGKDSRVASFMMPKNREAGENDSPKEDKLKWKITGQTLLGDKFVKEGVINNVREGYQYILRFSHNGGSPSVGGVFIGLDLKELNVVRKLNYILQPPTIQRPGGTSLAAPILIPKGKRSDNLYVEIGTVGRIAEVTLSGDCISELLGPDGEKINLMAISEERLNSIANKGIAATGYNDGTFYNAETNKGAMRLTFSPDFINSLESGTHEIGIYVQDDGTGDDSDNPKTRSSQATLTLIISEEIVVVNIEDLEEYSDPEKRNVTPTSVRLTGLVMDETVEISKVGIQYRVKGTEPWSEPIAGTQTQSRASGTYEFFVEGLQPNTTYQYRTVWTKEGTVSTSGIREITTATNKIPNGDFEEWSMSGKIQLLYNVSEMYWDSGNHGSSTMSVNVTQPSTSIKHGGKYSAWLKSQKVALFGIGKFAAGNAFIGQYLSTDGTDGILGWGRPFYFKPKALKGWVKYEPGTVGYTHSGAPDIVNGQPDKGIIYVALLTADKSVQGDANYPNWPVVVRTKDAHLFKKDESNVIAYGELVLHEATSGSGMIEFTIPIEYYESMKNEDVYYLLLVCSASKGGDYFAGGEGSTMYIDDFELVY